MAAMSERVAIAVSPQIRARMLAILALLIAITVVLFSFVTLVSFDRAIAPELHQRTRLIGEIIRAKVEQSVAAGIPIESIGGLDRYLSDTITQFPEVQRIALASQRGAVIAEAVNAAPPTLLMRAGLGARLGVEAASFSLPILVRNDLVGSVNVDGSAQFAETRLKDVLLDVSVLAMAVLLMGVELALAVAAASIWKPLHRINGLLEMQQRGQFTHVIAPTGIELFRRLARRLNAYSGASMRRAVSALPRLRFTEIIDIRLALFVFVAGAEVSASFLPLYAREAGRPDWLAGAMAAALPLSCYLIAVTALSPFGARLAAWFGAARLFVLAAIPTALSLLVMALSVDVFVIALARAGVGVCYALASIACQEYALGSGDRAEVARGSGTFLAMIYGGTFCGSVVGGVLAQHFGYPAALVAGAVLVSVGGAVGHATMSRAEASQPHSAHPGQAEIEPGARRRYVAITIGIAIPLNLVTAVFVWYLAPLQLAELGARASETARVIMLYYLAQILIGGPVTEAARSLRGRWMTLCLGAGITIAALATLGLHPGFASIVIGTLGVGIGHALLRGPVLALITQTARGAGLGLSGFRIAERIGALVGLLLTTVALGQVPTDAIFFALAGVVFVGVIIAAGHDWLCRAKGGERG